MQNQITKTHSEIAHEIKSAKRTMFKRHREGLPLRAAADQFAFDIAKRFDRVVPPTEREPATKQRESPAEFVANFQRLQNDAVERDRVRDEVGVVYEALESSLPDFIRGAIVEAIDLACDRFGIDRPTYDDSRQTGKYQTGAILAQLFAKTKLFKLDCCHVSEAEEVDDPELDHVDVTLPNGKELRLYGDAADLAKEPSETSQSLLRAMSELLHNPETPQGLFEAVVGFVTDQASSGGNILLLDPVLTEILKTVKPEDTHGAVCARLEAEFGGEVSHEASN